MSEIITTSEAAIPADLQEAMPEPTEAQEAPDAAETDTATDDSKPGREAAKYRRQLREAEVERDGLRGQLDAMRRAEVDRLADAAGLKPAGLWAAGTDLDGLLTDAGTIDAAKVAEAITSAKDLLGIRPPQAAPSTHGQGRVGVPVNTGAAVPDWQGAFQPRR